jgi:hypothetical protein
VFTAVSGGAVTKSVDVTDTSEDGDIEDLEGDEEEIQTDASNKEEDVEVDIAAYTGEEPAAPVIEETPDAEDDDHPGDVHKGY